MVVCDLRGLFYGGADSRFLMHRKTAYQFGTAWWRISTEGKDALGNLVNGFLKSTNLLLDSCIQTTCRVAVNPP